jgi:hypothetical protein
MRMSGKIIHSHTHPHAETYFHVSQSSDGAGAGWTFTHIHAHKKFALIHSIEHCISHTYIIHTNIHGNELVDTHLMHLQHRRKR